MTSEDILILALCNNDDKQVERILNNKSIKWASFYTIIQRHKIEPIILERIQKFQLPKYVRQNVRLMYKRIILSILEDHTILKKEWMRINDLFNESGIECLLMKGLSLNSSYDRIIGDLDILIHDNDLVQAASILTYNGYTNITGNVQPHLRDSEKNNSLLTVSWNNEFQFYNKGNGLLLELHTNLFQNKRVYVEDLSVFCANSELFWREKCFSDEYGGYVLSKENLLLLLCLHNAIKRCPGKNTFILRNMVDIHTMIGKITDWNAVIEKACASKIAPFVYFSLLLSRKLMSSPVPPGVLKALKKGCSSGECFLVRVHLRCLKTLSRSSILYSLLYRVMISFFFNTDFYQRLKWGFFIPVLFPPRWKVGRDFKLKKNSPLIFFAYFLNLFRVLYVGLKYIIDKK